MILMNVHLSAPVYQGKERGKEQCSGSGNKHRYQVHSRNRQLRPHGGAYCRVVKATCHHSRLICDRAASSDPSEIVVRVSHDEVWH